MKLVEINRPAIWTPMRSEGLLIRKYAGGYPYQTKSGAVDHSTPTNPITRYALNFEVGKVPYSIFMFSTETDQTKVEKFFESLKVTKKSVNEMLITASMTSFQYLDTYYEGEE